jgi:hypothetical protein
MSYDLNALLGNIGTNLSQQYMNQLAGQQQSLQQQQLQQQYLAQQNLYAPTPIYHTSALSVPPRCSYCGKRPKAPTDDRCDGCGAPR